MPTRGSRPPPRRASFSTPPLVKGVAPAAMASDITISAATVKLNFDRTTGALRYDVTTANMATDRVLALTLQRSDGDKPGPIVAHLMTPSQIAGSGTLIVRGRDREDLAAGRLYVHFYSRQFPLGAGRAKLEWR